MSKFEKHIGKGVPVEIDGEEFILKPLTTEFIPDFFMAMKSFSGEDGLNNMDKAGLKSIQNIIDATLERSYPDEPEEMRKVFGMKYMPILLPKIIEMNSIEPDANTNKALEKIEAIKKAKLENLDEK